MLTVQSPAPCHMLGPPTYVRTHGASRGTPREQQKPFTDRGMGGSWTRGHNSSPALIGRMGLVGMLPPGMLLRTAACIALHALRKLGMPVVLTMCLACRSAIHSMASGRR
jgi:hypothetical protein